MNLSSRIIIKPYIGHATIDNELVIMHLESNMYFRLNPLGTDIWTLLDAQPTVQMICDHIQSHYEVAFEQCFLDVTTFLQGLVRQDILTIEDILPSA